MDKEFLIQLLKNAEVTNGKIIITLPEEEDNKFKDKINQLSDETFTAICEDLGTEKVKELSDDDRFEEFVEYAKEWIDNKIDELQEELEMLNAEN